LISNIIGVPAWLRPAVRTEFHIKTGLVILGSGIIIDEILMAGAYGIGQALLVVGVVWYVCYSLARKMKVDEKFAASPPPSPYAGRSKAIRRNSVT